MTSRLLIAFVALCTVVLAVLIVPLGIAHQRTQRDDLTRRVERDAVAVASLATDLLRDRTRSAAELREYLVKYTQDTDARVVVVDASGIAQIDTDAPRSTRSKSASSSKERNFSSRPEIAQALSGSVVSGERHSQTLGYSLLYVAVPVTSGGRRLGAVRVSYPTDELHERTRSYWLGLSAIAITILLLASLVGLLLARWLARPLERLTQTASSMGEGDLAARADTDSGPPEVRHLARQFNESVDTLERLLAAQQEFVADASHQLRTPLHALRLRLENAQLDIASTRTPEAATTLEDAIAEVDRLAALVSALLLLERADRGEATPLEHVDVHELVERRIEAWQLLAQTRDTTVSADVPVGLAVCAREIHLEQVLDNLVDNAIGVSPAGGEVSVTGTMNGTVIDLHVRDNGPGMSDEQIDSAFQRFSSRTNDTNTSGSGGFGIGLAIVRRLTELDGGTVHLHRRSSGGLDAVVSLSCAPDQASRSSTQIISAGHRRDQAT